jgi:hypothetical protein
LARSMLKKNAEVGNNSKGEVQDEIGEMET